VWTAGANAAIDVLLLDGDTGTIEQTIDVIGVAANFYGLYGGAVDSQDHFWGSQLGGGFLVRVDRETFAVESWANPTSSYGITVDRNDRVWTCSTTLGRFDYATEAWDTQPANAYGGCTPGLGDMLWVGGNDIVGIDIETMQVVQTLTVPSYVHGVGMDFEGRVWGVTLQQEYAYRVDPDNGLVDTFSGLIAPYTYSDMTGTALAIVNGQL
jgi:streptogramin lyase